MATKKVLVRTLVAFLFQGVQYRGNELVRFDEKEAESLEKVGAVDSHKEAIAYCENIGIKPIDHKPVDADSVDGEIDQSGGSSAVGEASPSGAADANENKV